MIIDEALSKGLKSHFFKKIMDETVSAFKIFGKAASKIDLRFRNNYVKLINAHRECFKKVAVTYVVGGSKRNPFIGMILFTPEENVYLDRTENSIKGVVEAINIKNLDCYGNSDSGNTTFSISEHAVARVYQRSIHQKEKEVIDPFAIIREFAYIPLWSSFWCCILTEGLDPFVDLEICPLNIIIPAPNGIFLSKISKHGPNGNLKFIEIRTYVQNDKLTENQKKLREVMINAQKNLVNSVLCLFPSYSIFQEDQTDIEYESALIRDLIKLKLKDNIKDIATEFVLDDFMAFKFKSSLNDYFKPYWHDQVSKHFELKLDKFGYVGFSDEFRRLKQRSKNIINK